MIETETVIPVTPGLKLLHPISGELADGGGQWIADQFTFRMIGDGVIKRMAPGAKPAPAIVEQAPPKAAAAPTAAPAPTAPAPTPPSAQPAPKATP